MKHTINIKVIKVPANKIAEELGNDRIANMVLYGAYLKATGAVSIESSMKALEHILPEAKHKLLPTESILHKFQPSTMEFAGVRCIGIQMHQEY